MLLHCIFKVERDRAIGVVIDRVWANREPQHMDMWDCDRKNSLKLINLTT
jgi:hypothetical protein